jgi:hypothetical protein
VRGLGLILGVALWLTSTLSTDQKKSELYPPILSLPGVGRDYRLALAVTLDGRSPAVALETFLDLLFDWFDRDGNGSLDGTEVSRMFPLPLPGRNELKIDFDGLDADRNGKVS